MRAGRLVAVACRQRLEFGERLLAETLRVLDDDDDASEAALELLHIGVASFAARGRSPASSRFATCWIR